MGDLCTCTHMPHEPMYGTNTRTIDPDLRAPSGTLRSGSRMFGLYTMRLYLNLKNYAIIVCGDPVIHAKT